MDQEIDIKNTEERIKALVRDHGLDEAHEIIKRDYKFYPQMKKMMLGILYVEYYFYSFTNKERLKSE